jgi:hypothetical protein
MGKHIYEGGLMSAETSGETALPSFVEECSEFVVRGIGRRSHVCVTRRGWWSVMVDRSVAFEKLRSEEKPAQPFGFAQD